jgi:hypothetical protein
MRGPNYLGESAPRMSIAPEVDPDHPGDCECDHDVPTTA